MDIKPRNKGFTLIEVMIVVAIIGILSAIAYPSYIEYVQRARRSDGLDALLRVQLAQEKWRANNPTYVAMENIKSEQGFYKISVTDPSPTGYTAKAESTAAQVGEKCVALTLTISKDGEKRSEPSSCWK